MDYQRIDLVPSPTPGKLYLGPWMPHLAPYIDGQLREKHVSCVLSLGFQRSPVAQGSMATYVYDLRDSPDAESMSRMSSILEEVSLVLHSFLQEGRNVYIHCQAGISRSPTCVLYYLMRYAKLDLNSALLHLLSARPCVRPNHGFWRILEAKDREIRRRIL